MGVNYARDSKQVTRPTDRLTEASKFRGGRWSGARELRLGRVEVVSGRKVGESHDAELVPVRRRNRHRSTFVNTDEFVFNAVCTRVTGS